MNMFKSFCMAKSVDDKSCDLKQAVVSPLRAFDNYGGSVVDIQTATQQDITARAAAASKATSKDNLKVNFKVDYDKQGNAAKASYLRTFILLGAPIDYDDVVYLDASDRADV